MSPKPLSIFAWRPRSRRAVLARVGSVFLVLGILCLGFGALMAVASLLSKGTPHDKQQSLALIYFGAGVGFFLFRWLLTRVQGLMNHPHREQLDRDGLPADGGAVLILTLIVLALVAALLVQVRFSAATAARHAEAALLRDRLGHAAATAARDAMARLSSAVEGVPGTNDLLESSWESADPTGIVSAVRVTDENRYFDLNNLALATDGQVIRPPMEIAMDLMTLCGDFTPGTRAEALRDWVDEDEEGLYESPFYSKHTPAYKTPNRVLYGMRETLRIEGFDQATFDRHPYAAPGDSFKADLLDCITVLPLTRSQPVPINVNTASRPVLQAVMGIGQDDAVNGILTMRTLRPITDVDKVVVLLDIADQAARRPYLDTQSRFFRIDVRSFAEGRAVNVRALVHRSPRGRVETLQWAM